MPASPRGKEGGVAGKLSSHCRRRRLRNFLTKLFSPSCAILEWRGAQPFAHPRQATLEEAILQALHVVGGAATAIKPPS